MAGLALVKNEREKDHCLGLSGSPGREPLLRAITFASPRKRSQLIQPLGHLFSLFLCIGPLLFQDPFSTANPKVVVYNGTRHVAEGA
ncbi:hypothetical protein FA15DRAFT_672615 [Coprinopsis marcescibilis]|uniref:Uncharacterized protein n=1 Tax=Coprinopsis marcescibilis TaxID=230819 RepID=A0A5C3KM38_COPMA|nr:hypothetical protein FA15DRAFT_672615 [Coprinopsis marcescibilis]